MPQMSGKVLVAGGAGFIGSRLVDEPETRREDGLTEGADRLGRQNAADRVDPAALELERRGMTL